MTTPNGSNYGPRIVVWGAGTGIVTLGSGVWSGDGVAILLGGIVLTATVMLVAALRNGGQHA